MDMTMKEDVPLRNEFLVCGGIVTQVVKCGPWSNLFDTKEHNSPQLLFFVLPGNPGLPAFYSDFAKALYLHLKKQYPVWVINHAGHVSPPSDFKMEEEILKDPSPGTVEDPFGLNGQVEHKLAFLRGCVPANMKLVLIGHSMGSYVLLEMMKRAPQLPVLRSILLFPTIERIAKSPRGILVTPLLCWLRYLLYVLIYTMLLLIPTRVINLVISVVLQKLKVKNEFTAQYTKNSLNINCIANALYLGAQEMKMVVERDSRTIQKYLKKLTFYYGVSDCWCPIQFYEDIKRDFPDGDIRLCDKGIPHAFIMTSSEEMAAMIPGWLEADLAKI